jgi:hypothetical protein
MKELSDLTDKIEGKAGIIEANSKDGLENWARVSSEIAGRAKDVETLFASGTERILEATRLAEKRSVER